MMYMGKKTLIQQHYRRNFHSLKKVAMLKRNQRWVIMNNLLWPFNEKLRLQSDPVSSERHHAKKECKASSVLNKFKEMEERAANGEDEYSE